MKASSQDQPGPERARRHRRWRHRHGTPRLHLAIYKALLGVTVFTVVGTICFANLLWAHPFEKTPPRLVARGSELLMASLPADRPLAEGLRQRAEELGLELGVFDREGKLLGASVADPAPPVLAEPFDWFGGPGHGGFSLQLDDGRFLTLRICEPEHGHLLPFLTVLTLFLFAMAIGTRPVARRITRRLEALEQGMGRFGAGDLSARVAVRGKDEVARVAQAFNEAAGQVETLVGQQQRMLASASHELRAPLARLRMALELAQDGDADQSPERRARMLGDATTDIEELDALVTDLLMAARLSHPERSRNFVTVDLAALAREECRRAGLDCQIAEARCQGEPAMLRRLVRNLLDNARKYGGGGPIGLTVTRGEDGRVRLCVLDRGPGIPASERERIFEPFYRPQGHAETRDGGVGLGLSLVRQIAEHHGGTVQHQPREGGGSCFQVTLPGA